jgi:hypothetical protein
VQAAQRLGEALADLCLTARLYWKKGEEGGRRLEEAGEIVIRAEGDRPLTEDRAANTLAQRLGEIERQPRVFEYRALDALHLLLDVAEPARNRIARAVHGEGTVEGFGHQTALPMNRSASFIRSSPEMILGRSVSRRAVRVQDSQLLP